MQVGTLSVPWKGFSSRNWERRDGIGFANRGGGEAEQRERDRERGPKKKKKETNGPLHCWLLRLPQTNNRGKENSLLCSTGGFGSWALEII